MRVDHDVITFTVPGPPVGKERARSGEGGRHYTPEKTRDYEAHVRACFQAALLQWRMKSTTEWDMGGAFRLNIAIVVNMERHPDGSNVLKAIEDGIQGVAYKNDKRVIAGSFHFLYTTEDEVGVTAHLSRMWSEGEWQANAAELRKARARRRPKKPAARRTRGARA